jgi:hypothetical protein
MIDKTRAARLLCGIEGSPRKALPMSQATREHVIDQHLVLFGRIVQIYARYEVLIQEIMAAVSGADVTSIRLLTSGLNFTERQDALFNLLSHRAVPIDQIDQVRNYLQMPRTYTPLRNDITHSTWTEGPSQTTIRPLWLSHGPLSALKPVHDVGHGSREFIETYDDQVTYTLDDLREIGENLAVNYAGFRDYLTKVGLITSHPT